MKRVLVVEQDNLLRSLIGEWLGAEGIEACFAEHSGALVRLERIDAVLVDVPKPCGAQGCLQAWRRAYPDATIIAVSGRFTVADTGCEAKAGTLGVTRILAKPFTRGQLRAALGLA